MRTFWFAALAASSLFSACGPTDTTATTTTADTTSNEVGRPEATEVTRVDEVAEEPEVETTSAPDSDVETTPETTPECVPSECAFGCCETHCCEMDPAQVALTSLDGGPDGAITTPAELTFDTGANCDGLTALGSCETMTFWDDLDTVGAPACVCRFESMKVTGTLRIVGPNALVLLARDAITIEGTLDASADGTSPGPGYIYTYATRATGRTGGVGGSNGSADSLEPLTGGASGQNSDGGIGGGGGGALQLSAAKRITISGSVRAHGGGAIGGPYGGAGGGSGGSILIEAPRVDVTGEILAYGGGGAGGGGNPGDGQGGSDGTSGSSGGAGADGNGCALQGYTVGGDGGGGANAAGDASPGGGSDSRSCWPESWVAEGGGGGGYGRIRILTYTGCACLGHVTPTPALGDVGLH